MTKLVTIAVGALLGLGLTGAVVGLVLSLLVILVLGIIVLASGEGVPMIYNIRSLTQRGWTTGVTAAGLALVVCIFAVVLMTTNGVRTTLKATGSSENAKILRKGTQNEIQSGMLPEQLRLLGAAPETAIGKDGHGLASAELVVLIYAVKQNAKSEEDGTNLTVRGVGPLGLELHPPHALDGSMFKAGSSEIMVGKGLVGRYPGARLGEKMHFARRDWNVVGVMDHGGSAYDAEIWGDVDQFEDAFQRRPAFSSVTLKLKDAAALQTLRTRMESDPQLNTLEVKREVDYWSAQSEQLSLFVQYLGLFVAAIFSFGAILGAMITMYAQVAARTREIGTLRALGFQQRAVLVSFVIESVLLALGSAAIGLIGATAAQLLRFSTVNWQTFSEVSFHLHLTPGIVFASIVFAMVMGYAGGLLPALRASRLSIVAATKGG